MKQRATLGFILLHVNEIVASSTLLRALWYDEAQPASARKILHNAVWRLRATLEPTAGRALPRLDTRPPGYILQVDPSEVDLLRFRDAVTEGRQRLSAGDAETAAVLLGNALCLWRGPVLADLVEQGLAWPELHSVNEARLDAQEDWFDAELRCGRHQVILGELHNLVNGGTLRERACGQLMLALYRCGRQAEALDVYARMRGTLIELGLEPGQELRRLQHAILNHDLALAAPIPPITVGQPPASTTPAPERPIPARTTPVLTLLDPGRRAGVGQAAVAVAPPRLPLPRDGSDRRRVSVLMVRSAPTGKPSQDCLDDILATTAAGVCVEVERAGGVVATSIGSTSVAVFGLPTARPDDATRAIRAAVAMRDRLGSAFVVQAAVTTGVLRLSGDDLSPSAVTGVLADQCLHLLAGAGAGEIRVCGATHCAANGAFLFSPVDGLDDHWTVRATPSATSAYDSVPLVDRDCEMALLSKLVTRVRNRNHPHLLTVFGDAGTGKTRFLAEVRRQYPAVSLSADLPIRERPSSVYAALLGTRCDIGPDDGPVTARVRLNAALGDPRIGREDLGDRLLPLFTSAPPASSTVAAWAQAMSALSRDEPLVVTLDDLHCCGDELLDAVRDLVILPHPVPLCVVVGARPSLLDRRPGWGAGIGNAATITLDPLTDEAIDRIFEHLGVHQDDVAPAWLANTGCDTTGLDDRRDHLRRLLRLSHRRIA